MSKKTISDLSVYGATHDHKYIKFFADNEFKIVDSPYKADIIAVFPGQLINPNWYTDDYVDDLWSNKAFNDRMDFSQYALFNRFPDTIKIGFEDRGCMLAALTNYDRVWHSVSFHKNPHTMIYHDGSVVKVLSDHVTALRPSDWSDVQVIGWTHKSAMHTAPDTTISFPVEKEIDGMKNKTREDAEIEIFFYPKTKTLGFYPPLHKASSVLKTDNEPENNTRTMFFDVLEGICADYLE